ncbi:MAG: GNAT family N-acetyltransferase [Tissierellia bacterium]|nr:GNAT family N-acetyltransferase [Tissierellia bacterium]
MKDYILIKPDDSYADEIASYRDEFANNLDELGGSGALRTIDDPIMWIKLTKLMEDKDKLSLNVVPATQFIFVRCRDSKIVGTIQIRHYFNDYLQVYGGNIGYSIRPSERGKGYGSAMLRECLKHCRRYGLDRVLITCEEHNIASRKVIISNGGKYECTVYEPDENIYLERYWVDIEIINNQKE